MKLYLGVAQDVVVKRTIDKTRTSGLAAMSLIRKSS